MFLKVHTAIGSFASRTVGVGENDRRLKEVGGQQFSLAAGYARRFRRIERSGSLRWKLPLGERFLLKGAQCVYVMGPDRQVYAMKELSGDILGRYPLQLLEHAATNPADDVFYVANPAGYVYALRESKERY